MQIQPLSRKAPWTALVLLAWVVALPDSAHAQRLLVRAVDQLTGAGIPEAVLTLAADGRRQASDASGWIQFETLEQGSHEAYLSAPGYRGRRLRMEAGNGMSSDPLEVYLTPLVHQLPSLEVTAALTDEDRDALAAREAVAPTHQISGEALRDITDDGVGETLEKVAGVTVSKEEGSVTGISIRGAGARQTRVTLDGQSMAGGGRGTTRGAGAAGQIPREFLEQVEIMKATTPDMDADAIGGTVDFQTSRASRAKKPRSSLSTRCAYSDAGGTWNNRVSAAHSQPFDVGGGRRAGVLVAVNAEAGEGLVDELSVLNQWPSRTSPETGEKERVLARFRVASRDSSSSSVGVVVNGDLQLDRSNHVSLKTLWSERDTRQSAQFLTTEFITGRILSLQPRSGTFGGISLEKQFLERRQESGSGGFVLGAEHAIGDWRIDEAAGYSVARADSPANRNAVFRTARGFDGRYDTAETPEFPEMAVAQAGLPAGPAELARPELYPFTRYERIVTGADDEELSLRVNVARLWEPDGAKWTFKGGLKARLRDASDDEDKAKFLPAGTPFTLAEFARSGPHVVFRDRYAIGPAWSADAMEERFEGDPDGFIENPMDTLLDSSASDFSVAEDIHAAYVMATREAGRSMVVAGLRLESTRLQAHGYETVSRVEDGRRVVEITPVSINRQYDMLFPGMHLLHRVSPDWTLRASVTRTLQRPDFRDLSPSLRVDLDTRRIRSGNPDLQPYDARAVDVGTDFVINSWSSAAVGFFYKHIEDFIVDVEEETSYLGEPGFTRAIPVNGSPADLLGVEAALNSRLAFLPGWLEATDVTLNYTLTDSQAAYPGQPGVTIMLPDQVRETFNLSVRWRAGNWTVSGGARYRGLQLRRLVNPGNDQFNAGFWSLSASVSYKLNDSVNFSAGVSGLNRPDPYSYLGDRAYAFGTREGSRIFSIGLNVRFSPGKDSGR